MDAAPQKPSMTHAARGAVAGYASGHPELVGWACIVMAVVIVLLVLWMMYSKSGMTPGPGRSTGTSNHITGGNHPLPFNGSYSAGGHLADSNPEAVPGAQVPTLVDRAIKLDAEIAKGRAAGLDVSGMVKTREGLADMIKQRSHVAGIQSAADLATAGLMDGGDSTTLASILGSPCAAPSSAAQEDLQLAKAVGSVGDSLTI
jgi:hypothetical protein